MSYRQLATRPVLKWALVAIGARLPVAMTPLALVFLVRDRPGGYALGAGLAAAYVLGEVAGAMVLGPRLNADRARFQLAAGLALGACSFAGLGLLPRAPLPVLGILAVLAGAAPAAAPGGLRTLLISQLPDTRRRVRAVDSRGRADGCGGGRDAGAAGRLGSRQRRPPGRLDGADARPRLAYLPHGCGCGVACGAR
jgi:MFS family permease